MMTDAVEDEWTQSATDVTITEPVVARTEKLAPKAKKKKPAAAKRSGEPRVSGLTLSFILPTSLVQSTKQPSSTPRARLSPAAVQCFACQRFGHQAVTCSAELR